MSIEIVPVDRSNVYDAIRVACNVFKACDHEAIKLELKAAVGFTRDVEKVCTEMNIHRGAYVMALHDGEPAGISGSYSYIGLEQDSWLGWTSVGKDFLRRGIGGSLVQQAFEAAGSKNPDVQTYRIWTSEEPQFAAAGRLYSNLGFIREPYRTDALPTEGANLARIYSKGVGVDRQTTPLWASSSYPVQDLEETDMARLDQVAAARFAKAPQIETGMYAIR